MNRSRERVHSQHLLGVLLVSSLAACTEHKTMPPGLPDLASSASCAASPLWTQQPLGTSNVNYWRVWGSGPVDVYAVGNGVVRHSTDGGRNWLGANVPVHFLFDFQIVWGSSPSDVYVGGGSVWHSVDGGSSWTNPSWPLIAVWGLSSSDLFGLAAAGGVLHSSDAGKSWSPSFAQNVSDLWGSGASDLYLGAGGSIFHSNDDGQSWQNVLPAKMSLGGAGFSGRKGAVFSVGQSVIETVDDGQHWKDLNPPNFEHNLNLHSIWVSPDGNDIYAVGFAGTSSPATGATGVILHSSDAGASWAVELQCSGRVFAGVWGSAANDVYVVGEFDFIFHRTQ